MAALFDQAASAFGGVDVLVNNAGIMKLAPFEATDDALFDEEVAINLKGTLNGLRLAAQRLPDGGRIVSLSSSVIGLYQPTYGVYAATKAAIEAMTHVLSKEVGKRGFTVNAIAPGPVDTELFTRDKAQSDIEQIVGRTPLGRLGTPDDVAHAVSFLVGPDGAWINGRVIRKTAGSSDMAQARQVALVTGASSGFGSMIARELASAGHVAYATMRDTRGKNEDVVEKNAAYALEHGVDLRVFRVGHSVRRISGPGRRPQRRPHSCRTERSLHDRALTDVYDINVLGTQRLNRAALPHLRAAKSWLLIWISSTSVAGGVPPLLGPYFAAKAAMDALAVCYGKELAPLGIESSIVVPGAFTTGTNHFANAGKPDDVSCTQAYEFDWPPSFSERMLDALAKTAPQDADPTAVGRVVAEILLSRKGHVLIACSWIRPMIELQLRFRSSIASAASSFQELGSLIYCTRPYDNRRQLSRAAAVLDGRSHVLSKRQILWHANLPSTVTPCACAESAALHYDHH